MVHPDKCKHPRAKDAFEVRAAAPPPCKLLPGRRASCCLVAVFAVPCCQLRWPPALHAPSAVCAQQACLRAMLLSHAFPPAHCASQVIGAAQKAILDEEQRAKLEFLLNHAKGGQGMPTAAVEPACKSPGCCCMRFTHWWPRTSMRGSPHLSACRGGEEGVEEGGQGRRGGAAGQPDERGGQAGSGGGL